MYSYASFYVSLLATFEKNHPSPDPTCFNRHFRLSRGALEAPSIFLAGLFEKAAKGTDERRDPNIAAF